jgi:phosphonate transport system permease protein
MPAWVTWPARALIVMARSFHPVIVAILFVKAVGFGALAGILALTSRVGRLHRQALHRAIEEISRSKVEAGAATGAPFAAVLRTACCRRCSRASSASATYQLDSNLRNATMVGIVGAGGIGGTLFAAFQRFDDDYVCPSSSRFISLISAGTRCARRACGPSSSDNATLADLLPPPHARARRPLEDD